MKVENLRAEFMKLNEGIQGSQKLGALFLGSVLVDDFRLPEKRAEPLHARCGFLSQGGRNGPALLKNILYLNRSKTNISSGLC